MYGIVLCRYNISFLYVVHIYKNYDETKNWLDIPFISILKRNVIKTRRIKIK